MIIPVPSCRNPDYVSCVPARLKMFLDYWEVPFTIESIRKEVKTSRNGTSFERAALFLSKLSIPTPVLYLFDRKIHAAWYPVATKERILQDLRAKEAKTVKTHQARNDQIRALIEFIERGGIYRPTGLRLSELKKILKKGHPVIAEVDPNFLDRTLIKPVGIHAVVIIGYIGNKIIYRDPDFNSPETIHKVDEFEFMRAWIVANGGTALYI